MKILIVVNSLDFFLSHRYSLAKEFINKKYQVTVITDMGGKFLVDPHIRFIDFSIDRGSMSPLDLILKTINLRKILIHGGFNFYYFASHKSNILGGLASFFQFKVPTIFSISGLGYAFIDTSLKAKLIKFIILKFYKAFAKQSKSRFVFQNNDDLDLFLNHRILSKRMSTIIPGMGVDLEKFQFQKRQINNSKNKIKILFAGRLLIDKGINEFVALASRVKGKNFEFHIAGALDLENPNSVNHDDFKKCLKESNIIYHGYTKFEEMIEIYKSTDIFLLPSYREGFPKAALEAAATGQPLIMSDVPGCRDCIIDGFNGFLFKRGSIEEMESCLIKITNSYSYQYFSENSRAYVEDNFSATYIANQYIDLIQSI